MRKVVLYVAKSIDGFIADENGGVDWIAGDDESNRDMGTFENFIKTVDTVIMGWNTYKQITTELSPEEWPYENMVSYVMCETYQKNKENILFVNTDLGDLIKELKEQKGKDIWVCGGAHVINQIAKKGLIDKYMMTVVPKILGKGIALFDGGLPPCTLKLSTIATNNGLVEACYEKKK